MRPSTEMMPSERKPADPLTDERAGDWRPDRISDRKLLELRTRLDKLHRLGGAFAEVRLSDEAEARLATVHPRLADDTL